MNKENFFSKIDEIKNNKEIVENIIYKKRDIEKYEKQIEDFENDIDTKIKKDLSLICKLREINEEEKNHKDNIICNDLKDDKNEDYLNKKEELFESLKLGTKYEEDKILNLIDNIESSKEEIRQIEFSRSQRILTELEKARNRILIEYGSYIYDNEQNKKLIDILDEKKNIN